jgi:hypothetical protein
MNTLLTIATITTIICGGLWKLSENNYKYLYGNSNKILYLLLSFIIIPSLWELIILFFKKMSENKVGKDCHLNNIEMFNELTINNNIYLTFVSVSILSSLFLLFLIKIFNPNNKN